MKLIGQIVKHKTLGDGIIVAEKDLNGIKYFTVNFITEIQEFAFPGIFESSYMRFKDGKQQNEFNNQYLKPVIETESKIKQDISNIKNTEDLKKEFFSIRPLVVKATHYTPISNSLNADLFSYYGSNSLDIYLNFCRRFGWKSNLSDNFGRQGAPLFAENATPERYDVWFLSHSNYTENVSNLTWINKISDNLDTVFELWNDNSRHFDMGKPRIIFAKTSNDKYVFLGIYEVKNKILLNNGSRLRVFKRLSEVYPMKSEY